MINIVICDDDKNFLSYIENRIIKILEARQENIKIHKFGSGMELLKAYDKGAKPFDIILLDINMPKIDGLELAELIRKEDEGTILIFLTSMEEEVYKTFKYNTFRFIRKTHIDQELEEALLSAMKKLSVEKYIFKTADGEIALAIEEIIYFEFMDRVVHIVTFNSKFRTNIRRFKDVEDAFLPKGFVGIHRSCIVNQNYIKAIGDLEITLDNGEKLPVSRYRMEDVKKAFIEAARKGRY